MLRPRGRIPHPRPVSPGERVTGIVLTWPHYIDKHGVIHPAETSPEPVIPAVGQVGTLDQFTRLQTRLPSQLELSLTRGAEELCTAPPRSVAEADE